MMNSISCAGKSSLDSNIEPRDPFGRTPLMRAVLDKKVDEVARLINEGANLEAQDLWGKTPLLHSISMRIRNEQELDKQIGIIEVLVSHGVDVEARDERGKNALDNAIQCAPKLGTPAVINILLAASGTSMGELGGIPQLTHWKALAYFESLSHSSKITKKLQNQDEIA